ncbi:S8 family serine peptidase [Yersinia pekkanenii]|uniref:Subtilase family n=1 Tax=Yersinia pekkanenii TaxID=1288385 RepID=A0A0T9Q8Z2_9GAMM|nr:S8 family serine peptidase [Yersinia pekkanenii]CNI00810.1 Subtilase family [Yersinia pekkanenii]CRY63570.1 Subtilase family [Yersinia pekkanenii]
MIDKLNVKHANKNNNIEVYRRYRFNGEIYVRLCNYLDDVLTIRYKLIKGGKVCSEVITYDSSKVVKFKSQRYDTYYVIACLLMKSGERKEEKSHSIVISAPKTLSHIKLGLEKASLKGKLRIEQVEDKNNLKIMFKAGGLDRLGKENSSLTPIYSKFKSRINFSHCFSQDTLNKIIKRDTKSVRFINFFKIISDLNNDEMLALAQEIESFDYVEYCCISPDLKYINLPPILNLKSYLYQIKKGITPDLSALQGYLHEGLGMNVIPAWQVPFWSSLTTECRLYDFGVNEAHEDLINITVVSNAPSSENSNHGTATSGCIAGTSSNGIGIKGLVNDRCRLSFYDATTNPNLGEIIADAHSGDIIVLNIQAGITVASGRTLHVPASHFRSIWDQIYECVHTIGAVVILAAGNGFSDSIIGQGVRLDLIPEFNDWGDNGSSMISACQSTNGNLSSFSNSGSHVYMNSWGDSVTTTGYGDLQSVVGINTRDYTAIFNGTSSATALVGGAITLTQGYLKSHYGLIIDSYDMREIMRLTGYSNTAEIVCGRRPNVAEALIYIENNLLN